jgi:ATP-dependent helicase/nuclease subunit B
VAINKDGSLSARSQTASKQEYGAISGFVNKKIREFGKNILNGDIKVNPYESGNASSCTYCAYRSICGYDDRISGFSRRKLDMSPDEAMSRIISEVGESWL